MTTLYTRAWCLLGQNREPASLTPIVRFKLGEGAAQLKAGWDSADPGNAPFEWVEIETPPRAQPSRQVTL